MTDSQIRVDIDTIHVNVVVDYVSLQANGVFMSKKEAEKLYAMVSDICSKGRMTRLEVAEYLGVSERTLYRWLVGDASFPQMVFIALGLLVPEE